MITFFSIAGGLAGFFSALLTVLTLAKKYKWDTTLPVEPGKDTIFARVLVSMTVLGTTGGAWLNGLAADFGCSLILSVLCLFGTAISLIGTTIFLMVARPRIVKSIDSLTDWLVARTNRTQEKAQAEAALQTRIAELENLVRELMQKK